MNRREQVLAELNVAFRDKYHSLANYVVEARPYVHAGEEPILRLIERIAASDREAADQLAEVIEQLEGIPQVGIQDHYAAELNYLALAYLRGVLAKSMEDQGARYAEALKSMDEYPAAGEALKEILAAGLTHLEQLKKL